MAGLEADAEKYLDHAATKRQGPKRRASDGTPAILLDIDDTTLNTYSYEIYSNFVFNPTTNAAFVNARGLPGRSRHAGPRGSTPSRRATQMFFLTGRPETQTRRDVDEPDQRRLPDSDSRPPVPQGRHGQPAVACELHADVHDDQYKSLTRQHIESLGFDIVANFGDQFSDLTGGFADKTFKVPNPMYFLP